MDALLKRILGAVLAVAILVTLSYYYIDKPVAYWVYNHHLAHFYLLKWFTYIPDLIALAVIPYYIGYIIFYRNKSANRHAIRCLALANSVAIAEFTKNFFKWVFGRYWPETWTFNNPSLIKDNAYGFHFLHGTNSWYQSFPSGHTTLTFAAMSIIWIAYPRWRWLAVIVSLLVIIGLLGMNYHFVSDVIAGALLGSITAAYVAKISKIV